MASNKPLDQVLEKFRNYVHNSGTEKTFETKLSNMVHKVKISSLDQYEKNYCMRFAVPDAEVKNLFKEVPDVEGKEISRAFVDQLDIPGHAHMMNDPYYHYLVFLMMYGVRANNETLAKDALTLILFRLWNGRSKGSIEYCYPEVMAYVVSNMMDRKSLAHKYDTPLDLITEYFVPTMYEKYAQYLARDSSETKRIIEAGFNRLRQVFRSDAIKDLETGQTKYRSGLQPLYYKAIEQGKQISSGSGKKKGEDEETDLSDFFSSSSFNEQIDSTTNFIIMNSNPKYPDSFVKFLNQETKLMENNIHLILKEIHNVNYGDYIREILELFFKRIQDVSMNEICSTGFYKNIVQKRIISSKHTIDVQNIKLVVNELLNEILLSVLDKELKDFSDTVKGHWRQVIFYTIAFNIQKHFCR